MSEAKKRRLAENESYKQDVKDNLPINWIEDDSKDNKGCDNIIEPRWENLPYSIIHDIAKVDLQIVKALKSKKKIICKSDKALRKR